MGLGQGEASLEVAAPPAASLPSPSHSVHLLSLGEAVLTQPRLIFDPFLFSSSPPPPLQPSGVQMELSPTSFCQEQSWAACSLGGGVAVTPHQQPPCWLRERRGRGIVAACCSAPL